LVKLYFALADERKKLKIRGCKLNNLTSDIHYSLGVCFNYSLFVLLVVPISCF